MKGKTVIIILTVIVVAFYGAQYIFKIDFLKFWPRVILGIVGLSFMLLMHIYSIRKRKKELFIFKLFSYKLPVFLNIHITLATMGVALIIVHAIGSFESIIAWVAFLSMFIVWQSGFVGKYIFIKIPKDNAGLIMEKMNLIDKLEELNQDFIKSMKANHEDIKFQKFLIEYLSTYASSIRLVHKRDDFKMTRFISNFRQTYNAWRLYQNNLHHLRKHQFVISDLSSHTDKALYEEHIVQYEDKMREILLLNFQIEFMDVLKALFKNWHDVHVPLTYLFYTTAVLHVLVIALFSTYAE